MTEAGERIRAQFPGLYVTFLSILIGLVLEDLFSSLGEMDGLWPIDARAARIWVQAALTFESAIVAWIIYSHIAIARNAVPRLADSWIVVTLPGYLFFLNGLVGTPSAPAWFLAICGYIVVGTGVYWSAVRQARMDEGFAHVAPLARATGPLGINAPAFIVFFSCALASRAGWFSHEVETALMAAGLPVLLLWITWFMREWRVHMAGEPA